MCNLYSLAKGQQAIRELARAMRDGAGNLPPLPGIFPDYPAPIVRTAEDGVRELAMARWGMPSPVFALIGRAGVPRSALAEDRRRADADGLPASGSGSSVGSGSSSPNCRTRSMAC